MKKTLKSLLPLLLIGAVACGEDADTPKDVIGPDFGSADSLRSVQQKGELTFGEALEGTFDEDALFHGYRFASLDSGEFSVEITQRGSSRGLDTTLFVYGAKSSNDWQRIAFDDDAGYGALSKLNEVDAGQYRQFMIVVGTSNGMGRGNYRLTLECDNDACIDTSPVNLESCTDELYEVFQECVQTELENADWGYDDPAEEWSIDYCANDGGAADFISWNCESSNALAPEYCRATETQIEDATPECEVRLKDEYYIIDTISLGRLEIGTSLQEVSDTFVEGQPDYAWAQVDGYTTPEDASIEAVASTVRANNDRASGVSGDGEPVDRDTYRQQRYLPEDVLDAIEADYGTDYMAVELSGSYYVAAGAEEWTTIRVLHFADSNIAFAITESAGED